MTGRTRPLDCHSDVVDGHDRESGPDHASCCCGRRSPGQGARLPRLAEDAKVLVVWGVALRFVSRMGGVLMVRRMLVSFGLRLSLGLESRRGLGTVGEGGCFRVLNGLHWGVCLTWPLEEFEFLIHLTIRHWVQGPRILQLGQVACHPFGCGISAYRVRVMIRNVEFRQAVREVEPL